jgi:hypothetical protein
MESTVPGTPATLLTPRERWELIQQWWEGIVQGCDFATTQRAARIFSAFRQVLMAVPERDFWEHILMLGWFSLIAQTQLLQLRPSERP